MEQENEGLDMPRKTLKVDNNFLNEESFNALLSWLDPDRSRAGEMYENIRCKLLNFFEWNNCWWPEEYTDKAFDRVARKIIEGETIRTSDKYLYFHGVALNLLKECYKEMKKFQDKDIEVISYEDDEDFDSEELIKKQKRCLKRLPDEERKLIEMYCFASGREQKKIRRELAKSLGISEGALRVRISRIREKLRQCVKVGKM